MYLTIGMLAHVDAGKTTFCEQLLYHANAIRRRGRVDHADSFMDDHPLEKRRGITIFSQQASFPLEGNTVQIVDTPGHADFSAEMERALSVLDAAVLLVSCVEGIQAHTRTIWRLLEKYRVPVLVFCNKTDRAGADPEKLARDLRREFSGDIVPMSAWPDEDSFAEEIAARDEGLLARYLEGEFDREAWLSAFSGQFRKRAVFPLLTGSALQDEGIDRALSLLAALLGRFPDPEARAGEPFSARVYKVRADAPNGRLVYMKVLSGALSVRDKLGEEKVSALYAVQGGQLQPIERAVPGMLAAAVGLSARAGERVGAGAGEEEKALSPMLLTTVEAADGAPVSRLLAAMRILEEEDPLLAVEQTEGRTSVDVRVMGKVHIEVLESVLSERFGIKAHFGPCRVRYLETIRGEAMGVGHYEPLRHYAEARLLLREAPRGSGISFESRCHVDFLPLQWQNLIRETLLKRRHRGVLTGAELTDVTIILLNGRFHLKHTEGGDFYEACGRAVRNALMKAESVLLEPVCRFTVTAPAERFDAVVRELLRIHAETADMERGEETCTVSGTAAAAAFLGLVEDLPALTHGRGAAQWEAVGYVPCRDAEAVIAQTGYDPLADVENSPHSVFCAKGAGFVVQWDKVEEWAHTAESASYD